MKFAIGLVTGILVVGAFLGGKEALRLRRLSDASASYLFAPTEVKGPQGKALSRAELLDLILRDAVKKANEQK